jgi:anti-sigma factor ChrR (cupin superfamily)
MSGRAESVSLKPSVSGAVSAGHDASGTSSQIKTSWARRDLRPRPQACQTAILPEHPPHQRCTANGDPSLDPPIVGLHIERWHAANHHERKWSTLSNDLQPVELTAIDTNTQEWIGFPIPQQGVELPAIPLVDDPDTGMQVLKIIYRAGWTNPWHSHSCAHGIYVLEGSLTTHQGTYGPGSFVWFPEGGIMEHGASADGDCTFLFITNKPFDIHYVDKE